MRVTRHLAVSCCLAALCGCAKSGDKADTTAAMDTSAPAAAMAPATTGISLADVAGKWRVRSTPESGKDMTPNEYVLTATADTTGWSIAFPNRKQPVPVRISISGDSIITKAGPFESVRRKGVQVTTDGVMRLQNGRLTGTTVAHYKTRGADSVLTLRTEGTRAP